MKIGDKIIDEKLQYDMNTEVAKIAELSSGKVDQHKYLTGVVILPPDHRRNDRKNYFYFLCFWEKDLKNKLK